MSRNMRNAMAIGALAHMSIAAATSAVGKSARQQGKTEPDTLFDHVEPEPKPLPEAGTREGGIPDRISMLRGSPFYGPCECIGVKLDGVDKNRSVVEFCVSGGWLRIAKPGPDGKLTAYAAQNAEKVYGRVDAFWKCQPSRQTRRQLARMNNGK